MSRPDFVTNEDIARWSENIDNDSALEQMRGITLIREMFYAGLWLAEQLQQNNCSPENIVRLQYTAAQLSFGKDPWQVHQEMLDDYINNRIEFEIDYDA